MSKSGKMTTYYTARGLERYELTISHDGLNKFQTVTDRRIIHLTFVVMRASLSPWLRHTPRPPSKNDVFKPSSSTART